MEEKIVDKIVTMLKSDQEEMCTLAAVMFQGLTNDYADYKKVRDKYNGNAYIASDCARRHFNKMFNSLNEDTFPQCMIGKKDAHLRRTSLTSQQKRQEKKKRFKKQFKN